MVRLAWCYLGVCKPAVGGYADAFLGFNPRNLTGSSKEMVQGCLCLYVGHSRHLELASYLKLLKVSLVLIVVVYTV